MIEEAGPTYELKPRPLRHRPRKVDGLRGYERYRPCLRLEFGYSCAYCLSAEREVGRLEKWGGFEVEHFRPKGKAPFKKLRNHYFNLLWACHACNRAKGSHWPDKDAERRGERYANPCEEALGEHLVIRGRIVEPVNASSVGRYMIRRLRLNSDLHRERRKEREELATNYALAAATVTLLEQKQSSSAAMAEAAIGLAHVKEKIAERLRAPWDKEDGCLCGPG